MTLLPLTLPDFTADAALAAALLDLNNAHATELSHLDHDRLAHLIGQARFAWHVGRGDGFMLALDESAAYDSPNYIWFRERFDRFIYVDRIVIAPQARGRGLARSLYERLIRDATNVGQARIVCEVNLTPPNPHSDAFHAALGFDELGSASIHGGAKTVRYLVRALEG